MILVSTISNYCNHKSLWLCRRRHRRAFDSTLALIAYNVSLPLFTSAPTHWPLRLHTLHILSCFSLMQGSTGSTPHVLTLEIFPTTHSSTHAPPACPISSQSLCYPATHLSHLVSDLSPYFVSSSSHRIQSLFCLSLGPALFGRPPTTCSLFSPFLSLPHPVCGYCFVFDTYMHRLAFAHVII